MVSPHCILLKDLDRTDPSESEPRFYFGSIVLTTGIGSVRLWGFRIGDISGEKGIKTQKAPVV